MIASFQQLRLESLNILFPIIQSSLYLFLLQDSCPSIKNVKYYTDDWPTLAAKSAYEKSVFTRTLKINACTEGHHLPCSSSQNGESILAEHAIGSGERTRAWRWI
ncbi:unnamed protein product [Musa acuminata subsp. malaccensis]|uniref:(wild Malaysian banana) hypothetical protein n=1 Tax=Musa acuminata subsp. malaccensis TaxID=214687 RepID=A0A804KZ96_MUSAM|nr:unnamed protein product [Musa acuminata subsp. malaccensis]